MNTHAEAANCVVTPKIRCTGTFMEISDIQCRSHGGEKLHPSTRWWSNDKKERHLGKIPE